MAARIPTLQTLLDAPEPLLSTHDRLRADGFPIVTLINARTALDARVWLGQWAQARSRPLIVAPGLEPDLAFGAYASRLSAATGAVPAGRAPLLRLPGPVRSALPAAAQLAGAHPGLAVVLACGLDDMVESLLDPALPQPLVSAALQGLVAVDEVERRVMARIASSRQVPLLRGPSEGILFYMLEARPQTRGRFTANARITGDARRSHEVDLACLAARLVVEIDGPEHHGSRRKSMDEAKQRDLEAHGFQVTRFANATVIDDPVAVWRDVAATLSRRLKG